MEEGATPVITALELKKMIEKGEDFVLIDMRSPVSYAVQRIPNAINMTLRQLDAGLGEFDKSKKIVVYCSSPSCMSSGKGAAILSYMGYKVFRFEEGIEGWSRAGFPFEGNGR